MIKVELPEARCANCDQSARCPLQALKTELARAIPAYELVESKLVAKSRHLNISAETVTSFAVDCPNNPNVQATVTDLKAVEHYDAILKNTLMSQRG